MIGRVATDSGQGIGSGCKTPALGEINLRSLVRLVAATSLVAAIAVSAAQPAVPLGVNDIPRMIATHEANVARFQTTYRARQFEGVGRVEAVSPTASRDLFAVEISVSPRSRVRCIAVADLAANVDRGSDFTFRGTVREISAQGVVLDRCDFTKLVRLFPYTPVASAKPGMVLKDCDVCPEMVVIPGGSFLMGLPPGVGREHERPQRRVTIEPFTLGRTEVTQAQWFAVMGERPGNIQSEDQPVEMVLWDDAQEFVRRLSSMTGRRYRLPSEAEWEYAARAGSQGAYSFGDDVSQLERHAWFGGNSGGRPQPVGRKQPNAFGLFDMHGNVWEWVEDCWNRNYSGAPTNGRAWTSGECAERVVRGGSWFNGFPIILRAAYRGRYTTTFRSDFVGFRVVRTD
ncbi:MAG: hypothetical protein RL322_3279 [Pseudomonadota bacterium]